MGCQGDPEKLTEDEALEQMVASEGMGIDELRADNLRLRHEAVDLRKQIRNLTNERREWHRDNDLLRKERARTLDEQTKLRRIILAALDVEDPDA